MLVVPGFKRFFRNRVGFQCLIAPIPFGIADRSNTFSLLVVYRFSMQSAEPFRYTVSGKLFAWEVAQTIKDSIAPSPALGKEHTYAKRPWIFLSGVSIRIVNRNYVVLIVHGIIIFRHLIALGVDEPLRFANRGGRRGHGRLRSRLCGRLFGRLGGDFGRCHRLRVGRASGRDINACRRAC